MNDFESLRALLIRQVQRYPGLQVQDLFKLIYQNEFGGGHLVVNETDSLRRLESEIQSLPNGSQDTMGSLPERFESIGNGLCRMNLAWIEETGIDLSTVNRLFIETARFIKGTRKRFAEKLGILRACLQDRIIPYDPADLDAMIKAYDWDRCPPVSHSPACRQLYHPAYRIVRSAYGQYFDVFCRIDPLLKTKRFINVALDGFCGSGKSTLAALLQPIYSCNVIPMDHFFLPPQLRTAARLDEPGGNIDYERFMQEVAPGLRTGQAFRYRIFNCRTMSFSRYKPVAPNRLNIIEGSYSLHPKFVNLYDLKIFLQIDPEEQKRRLLRRSGPDLLRRFIEEWIPMENRYFAHFQIAAQSDLIIRQTADQSLP